MGGDEQERGITQAIRCVEAMEGQDEVTRLSLWRAASKYAQRDRMAGGVAAAGLAHGLESPDARLRHQ